MLRNVYVRTRVDIHAYAQIEYGCFKDGELARFLPAYLALKKEKV